LPGSSSEYKLRAIQVPSSTPPGSASTTPKRIAIFIVTYNAVSTLRKVLDRIPDEVWDKVEEVFVFDDGSQDDTFLVGMGYKAHHGKTKLSVFRNEKNLGYGGNQIRGYTYAIAQGYDIVVLLHGDGQYAPEALPEILAPLEAGDADAVFGSRMMTKGAARKGGMPLYKFAGNKILTAVENAMLGMALSEFHSGYRAYSCHALQKVPFQQNTHDFHFDTQIIIQFHAAGLRILEVPIPTYYGDEICHVNGIKYARDVVRSVIEYELHELGLHNRPEYNLKPAYTMKHSPLSSHAQLRDMVGPPPRRVLDIGCGQGELAHTLKQRGHTVFGVDREPPRFPLDGFVSADLTRGLPLASDMLFDTVILADVLEHMPDPMSLLMAARAHLAPGGSLLVSLPNAVHWSVRAQILAGRFEYANKGILDRTHLRFFTQSSAEQMFAQAGLSATLHRTTPVPWERVFPAALERVVSRPVERLDYFFGRLRPNVSAYQHIFELRPDRPDSA
jgi:2-polyprenyl-3-methyl-5-hydroxy-6-metoxy-1,4-benzoquinol methylase